MMYCTQADIVARFGESELKQLTDRAGANTIDSAAVEAAIADAAAEIDGYIATRYTLPLESVPKVITRIAVDIALYQLFMARRMGATEEVRYRYTDVRKLLENIAAGKVSLGVPSPLQSENDIVMTSAPSVWSRRTTEDVA
jgi:phage gp36-like protein